MKKKFLIFTLCFTIIFSSININNKSYADGGIISLPMLATVSSLAVASGIVIKNNDDLYDLGRLFYEYIQKQNDLTWEVIKTTFNSSVSVLNNGLVSTDSKFLDIVKGFFDTTFNKPVDIVLNNIGNIPTQPSFFTLSNFPIDAGSNISFSFGTLTFDFTYKRAGSSGNAIVYDLKVYSFNNLKHSMEVSVPYDGYIRLYFTTAGKLCFESRTSTGNYGYYNTNLTSSSLNVSDVLSFPYQGGYTWDNVENKKENNSVSLPIPGNLGNLVGQGSTDFWDNKDVLVGVGDLSIPNVESPSISLDDVVSFPTIGDTPSDTPSDIPFSSITDYIIGLVVPSDSYWTDTWNDLYNNFTSSFPLVDMDNFNNLVTGEKKFPNIDINIMGVKGRVVNGDVINSIVDWLRPIVAGFMMLCLMLFNYRKIYKTIRGVEPFQGIAHGTSDFRTGISEYNYMGTGLSKSDYEANQMELAKALYDYEQDTGKTYKIKI